ncbi:NADPH-dependent F420 reductase, partial [Streptomyces sp. NPDC059082]|uniref:NADPH-dependent F420 reductase n=1 Tax=Streptomyces sp. NPDC059082 TaxID=3346720 RepID=UPI0036998840
MRVGVMGTGAMARALGGGWVRAGHEVLVGGRDADRTAALAASTGARPGTLAEAARFGGATLLALPYDAVLPVLGTVGPEGSLGGRILIDCTNAVGPGPVLTTPAGPRAPPARAAGGS